MSRWSSATNQFVSDTYHFAVCTLRGENIAMLTPLVCIREYRQAHFKPYRLIYRVSGKQVIIYIIADGRRDMQSLLMRRMLGV